MISCELCKQTFTRMQSLDRHNASKMHKNRSKAGVEKYTCGCGKYYLHQNSVRNHKMKCTFKESAIIVNGPPQTIIPASAQDILLEYQQKAEQQMNVMKQGFDKEIKEIKDSFEEETRKIKAQFLEYRPHPVNSREKRKKISKEVRQLIVEKQGKACGECKLILTPYFQLDHIIGLQFGGTDDESNLMALCCECHSIKSISENQCRKQIQDALQNILKEKRKITVV